MRKSKRARATKRGEADDPLFTITEAANAVGSPLRRVISVDGLRDLVRTGELPVVRVGPRGGKVFVLRSALRAFVLRGGVALDADDRDGDDMDGAA